MKLDDSGLLAVRKVRENKYVPHDGAAARKRRLRQIAAGSLKGDYVTTAARYVAIGLTDPSQPYFIKDIK